jgi:ribosomal silencing factor RsfS
VALAKVADDTKAQDLVVLNVVRPKAPRRFFAAARPVVVFETRPAGPPPAAPDAAARGRGGRPRALRDASRGRRFAPVPSFTRRPSTIAAALNPGPILVMLVPQAPLVSWTSYFVMCSVVSKPQLLAVLARMEKAAEEDWGRVKQNRWACGARMRDGVCGLFCVNVCVCVCLFVCKSTCLCERVCVSACVCIPYPLAPVCRCLLIA